MNFFKKVINKWAVKQKEMLIFLEGLDQQNVDIIKSENLFIQWC